MSLNHVVAKKKEVILQYLERQHNTYVFMYVYACIYLHVCVCACQYVSVVTVEDLKDV